MTNLKIRKILISDLKLFRLKGAPCEEIETCFLYKGFLIRGNLLLYGDWFRSNSLQRNLPPADHCLLLTTLVGSSLSFEIFPQRKILFFHVDHFLQ